MRILFVTLTRHDEPLGIMYLSGILKNLGHEVRGVMLEKENIFEIIKDFKPELIGYSAMSCERTKILNTNSAAKAKYRFFSLIGGPLATFSPDIINDKDVDAICRGEAEGAMPELVDALEKKGDIRKIRNIWAKINGNVYKNEVRPLIEDVDSIPLPDRTIFKDLKKNKVCNLISGRGCPFDCTYCYNTKYKLLYKEKSALIRYRSVDNLIEELKEIVKSTDPRIFWFQEDHFYTNLKILKEFSTKYKNQINKPFICSLRPEFLSNEDMVKTLKEANCRAVFTGCEAGNDRIRQKVLNRKISKGQIIDACDLLNKYHINIGLQNMLGIPTAGFNDDIETLELNIRCRPYYAWASICTPYPSTELFATAERAGLIGGDYFNGLSETYHSRTSLKLPYAYRVNALHKIFALVVEYPSLLPLVKEPHFYSDIVENEIDELKDIFNSFKAYKYEKLYNEKLTVPEAVTDFVDGFRMGLKKYA